MMGENRRKCGGRKKETTVQMVKTHRSLGAGFGREMKPFFCQRLSGDYVCCQKKDRCRKVKRRYLREYNLLLEAFCEKGTNTFNCDQCFRRCENVHMCAVPRSTAPTRAGRWCTHFSMSSFLIFTESIFVSSFGLESSIHCLKMALVQFMP